MSRKQQATTLHGKGANCAQSVLCSFADRCAIDLFTQLMGKDAAP